jgi:hypothetical protein
MIKIFNFATLKKLKGKRSDMDMRPIRFCSASNEESEYAFTLKFGRKTSGK